MVHTFIIYHTRESVNDQNSRSTTSSYFTAVYGLNVNPSDRISPRHSAIVRYHLSLKQKRLALHISSQIKQVYLSFARQFQAENCLNQGNGLHVIQLTEVQLNYPPVTPA